MSFVRPIVHVYQEYTTTPVVSPTLPDLNCCFVGPAYYIQDYPTAATDIQIVDFIKSGYTKNAACTTTGTSSGRPDASTTFVTLANPPNHISGGVLDAASVDVVFDSALIELAFGADGALAAGSNVLTAATGDFVNKKVAVGDRVVLTNDLLSATLVTTVKAVTSATKLELVTDQHTAVGTADVRWRVEHELQDQHIDTATYVTIVGNTININTTPTSVLLSYESLTWKVNYAAVYIGYRELRTDLQDVQTLNSGNYAATLGTPDERNPLAAAAQVAFSNTTTTLQFFGVGADTLAGHQSAIARMSTRDDIYAIVPLTDPATGMSTSTFLSVISAWKAHCVAYADPDRAKFRIVIGSYPELPTEKSSAPSSVVGTTEALGTDPIDVFVDPAVSAEFVTLGVGSSHLLDISNADALVTMALGTNIFTTPGYTGAKALYGAIGEKRLRTTTAFAAVSGKRCDYAVREAILASEGGTPVATADDCTWVSSDAGATTTVTKTGSTAFSTCQAGDIVHVTNSATHNDGYLVLSKTADTVKINLAYDADANSGILDVKVYRPVVGVTDATWSDDHTITKTSGFTGATIGDIAIITPDKAGDTTNRGMWVVTAADANHIVVATDGTYKLADPGSAITNVAIFHTVASHGIASVTTRRRLTRLRDNTAHFITTVKPDEIIEIPYPANVDPLHWDTATTTWPIDTVVSDELLIANLTTLEELAPKDFVAEYSGDCAYRISITLDQNAQVTELNTVTTSLQDMRCVMVWPNEVLVADLENALTGVQNRQTGQYLAVAVGGMVAGLPSHEGFSFTGVGGIQQIFNSNFYFDDDQLTNLRNGGWYVFVQDSESSLPYTIHEVTTNVSAYEFGELMNVKNFDYVSLAMKAAVEEYKGRYNLLPETITAISRSIKNVAQSLQTRTFPRIGAPLIDAVIENTTIPEVDRLDIFVFLTLPRVLNQIGVHLRV